jgi:hypothetical protein
MNTPLFSAVQGFVRLVTEYQEKGRQHVLETHGLELSDWERGVLNALNTPSSGGLPFAALRKELARSLKRSLVHASTLSQLIDRLGSGSMKTGKKGRGLVETTTVGARQDEETAVNGNFGIRKRKPRKLSVSLTALGRRVAEALAEADEFPFAFMAKTIESFPDAEEFRQMLQDAARGFAARAQRGTPAGVYDCFLHGENHSVIDYEAASLIINKQPLVYRAAIANRVFLRRAVQFLTMQKDVLQFIDIGCGFPTAGNTHNVAQSFCPEARVVYVDNDVDVVDKSNKLLDRNPYAKAIRGDLRDPAGIIENAVATGVIKTDRPVCVILVAVLHFITDEDKPSGMTAALKVMQTLREALRGQFPKSYLAMSHALDDDRGLAQDFLSRYTPLVAPACCRTKEQILRLLEGIDLLEPSLEYTSEWHRDIQDPYPVLGYTPIESYEKEASMALAAVGQVV